MSSSERVAFLKASYIQYFADVPVQKYAAMAIARDEDTIMRWKKSDQKFADDIQRAKAEWIRKRLIATKAEFALDRLESEVFSSKGLGVHEDKYEKTMSKIRMFLDDVDDGGTQVG